MPLRLGRRVFAPTARLTLLTLLLAAACVRLGLWQWHKWVHAEAQWARFARGAEAVQPLGARALPEVALFQRVSLSGRLDGAHQFLLDNRSWRGRAGYEVLTPLARSDGRMLLVDRGWVPFTGSRRRLPAVALPDTGEVSLSGRVADLPSPGLASGRAPPPRTAPWPKVTSFPAMDDLAEALGHALDARILLLDPQAPFGFVREWQPPGLAPLRYLGYAIQWWCFAALALVLWAIMSLRTAAP
ncbi:MAG TPA: SURF1 family protein [Steroidobacteraceae bacterium]|nr:SURF1 family protein [Steroidobacteraceae bacterium]